MTAPTRVQRLRAMRAGRFAALRDLPATACPYPVNGTPAERVLVLVFLREYLHHRPPAPGAIDHTT